MIQNNAPNTREIRGKTIAELGNQIERIDEYSYRVKSQTCKIVYKVKSTEIGWKCTCLDHQTRGVKSVLRYEKKLRLER